MIASPLFSCRVTQAVAAAVGGDLVRVENRGREAELVAQLGDGVDGNPVDPGGAQVQGQVRPVAIGPQSAPHPVARLENRHRASCSGQVARRGEPRDARPDNQDGTRWRRRDFGAAAPEARHGAPVACQDGSRGGQEGLSRR